MRAPPICINTVANHAGVRHAAHDADAEIVTLAHFIVHTSVIAVDTVGLPSVPRAFLHPQTVQLTVMPVNAPRVNHRYKFCCSRFLGKPGCLPNPTGIIPAFRRSNARPSSNKESALLSSTQASMPSGLDVARTHQHAVPRGAFVGV